MHNPLDPSRLISDASRPPGLRFWDEGACVAESVSRFSEPRGCLSGFFGDVRRSTGGNRLTSGSSCGGATEITPLGRIVWSAVAGRGQVSSWAVFLPEPYLVGR